MKVAVILLAAASFPPFNRGEHPGDVLIVEEELANDLIKANLAEMAPEQPQQEKFPAEPKEQPKANKEQTPPAQDTDAQTAESNKEQAAPVNEPVEEVPAEPKPTAKKK